MASSRRVLITGGAGFLGVNAASAFAGAGWLVTVLDNLSRPGTERNLDWLTKHHAGAISFVHEDLSNATALDSHVRDHEAIVHLAGQVDVTTSLLDPVTACETNARPPPHPRTP